jgi:hypothetical protein
MGYDSKTRKLYVPSADLEVIEESDPTHGTEYHQKVKPGTFRVLVLEP